MSYMYVAIFEALGMYMYMYIYARDVHAHVVMVDTFMGYGYNNTICCDCGEQWSLAIASQFYM